MSISSVSAATTASYTTNSQQKDVRNAFKQVADAINNNDLQGAQNAFDNLAQLLGNNQQNGQSSTDGSTQTSSNGTDFSSLVNQIGSALQSGDLDQAKQALQNLQQSAQSSRPHHHHHHGGQGGGAGAAASQPTPTTSTATSASTDPDSASASGIDLTV